MWPLMRIHCWMAKLIQRAICNCTNGMFWVFWGGLSFFPCQDYLIAVWEAKVVMLNELGPVKYSCDVEGTLIYAALTELPLPPDRAIYPEMKKGSHSHSSTVLWLVLSPTLRWKTHHPINEFTDISHSLTKTLPFLTLRPPVLSFRGVK